MNEASASQSVPVVPFHFADRRQMDEFAESVDDVVYRISKTKSDFADSQVRMIRTKSLLKNRAAAELKLSMNKPAVHPRGWEGSPHVSKELVARLRVPIDLDASGSKYSPWRDLPRTKSGQAALARSALPGFLPGEMGKNFGEPPVGSCGDSYQFMLERHLVRSVERVEEEYTAMPWATVAVSERKGGVGRDLASLKERLGRIRTYTETLSPKRRSLAEEGSRGTEGLMEGATGVTTGGSRGGDLSEPTKDYYDREDEEGRMECEREAASAAFE